MRRSFGVTFSAVVVLLGSGLTLLFALVAALGAIMKVSSASQGNLPPVVSLMMVFLYLAFGGWGIASGVGLLQLRGWARISMLIYCGLLLFVCFPSIFFILLIPLPGVNSPGLPADFMVYMRIVLALVYGVCAAIAGTWMWFFLKKSTRAQFQGAQPIELGNAVPEPLFVPAVTEGTRAYDGARIGIRVIGAFLLLGACAIPLSMIFYSSLGMGAPIPALFFGFLLTGWPAKAALLLYAVISGVAGAGLLKLRPWSRALAIGLQVFALLNLLTTFLIPGGRERYTGFIETAMASVKGMPVEASMTEFIKSMSWFSLLWSVPIVAVILWFLITRKEAFSDEVR